MKGTEAQLTNPLANWEEECIVCHRDGTRRTGTAFAYTHKTPEVVRTCMAFPDISWPPELALARVKEMVEQFNFIIHDHPNIIYLTDQLISGVLRSVTSKAPGVNIRTLKELNIGGENLTIRLCGHVAGLAVEVKLVAEEAGVELVEGEPPKYRIQRPTLKEHSDGE